MEFLVSKFNTKVVQSSSGCFGDSVGVLQPDLYVPPLKLLSCVYCWTEKEAIPGKLVASNCSSFFSGLLCRIMEGSNAIFMAPSWAKRMWRSDHDNLLTLWPLPFLPDLFVYWFG